MYSTASWLSILIETTNQQESPTLYKLVSISKQEGEFLYCTLRNTKVNELAQKFPTTKPLLLASISSNFPAMPYGWRAQQFNHL